MRMITAILAFFIIAQLLGIFTGITILLDITKNPYVTSLVVTGDAENPFNALFFITYMLLGAVVMVLLIRLFKLHFMVFRVLEFVMIATASSVVFYAFLRLASMPSTMGGSAGRTIFFFHTRNRNRPSATTPPTKTNAVAIGLNVSADTSSMMGATMSPVPRSTLCSLSPGAGGGALAVTVKARSFCTTKSAISTMCFVANTDR